MRRGLIGGGVLAVLWFLCGWMPYFLSAAGGSLGTLGRLIPSPMSWGMFGSPPEWAAVEHVLVAIALVGGFALISSWAYGGAARRREAFAAGWLAAVLASFAVGAVLDLGAFVSALGWSGVRGAASSMGITMMTAWWAVVTGWLPALVVSRSQPQAADVESAPKSIPAWMPILTVLALIMLPFAAAAGHEAGQAQLRQDQADAEAEALELADPDGAAPRDPDATGDPVPTAAPADGPKPDLACTAETTTIMAPAPDAATGRRGQWIQLVNVSEQPCVVEGYPDVAYGDQNGHLLDVTVEHGRSFMAEDPGASPVTLQPGESASAVIGWNANSVNGQLAARSLWLAVRPGEQRLTWDVSLDIIPGATVHVTAWQTAVPPGS